MKEYIAKPKTVHLMHRCKKCKKAVRTSAHLESMSVDNEHPEWYLRKVRHYRKINHGEYWIEASNAFFPPAPCPGCGVALPGKAIEGYLNPKCPCDRRCTGATGHNCECSCGGENHGMDHEAVKV